MLSLLALLQLPVMPTVVRVAVALVAGFLFYLVLRDDSRDGVETSPPPDAGEPRIDPGVEPAGAPAAAGARPTADLPRRVFFAVLGALVVFQLSANWIPESRGRGGSGSQAKAFEGLTQGLYYYRVSHTNIGSSASPLGGSSPRQEALESLREAAKASGESVTVRRTLGIVLAGEGKYPEALKELSAAAKLLAERAPERAKEEGTLWRTLYGPTPPTVEQVRAAQAQVQRFGLGWLGRTALAAAAARIPSPAGKALRNELSEQVAAQANAQVSRLVIGIVVAMITIPLLGLITFFVSLVLIPTGVLSPARKVQHRVSAILWETWILMMALFIFSPLLLVHGPRPSPELQPRQVAPLLLFGDLAQLPAIGYLAWRLRSRGLGLREMGLTTRHFWANLAVGFAAATVVIPSTYLVGCLTQFVSNRFFPNVAPPYHPLQGMTAGTSAPEIRMALFLAAAVGAPLLEEIFFRGCLFGAIRRRRGLWPALLGSAAIFAALHPQLPLGFLPIAALGAVFAALYDWRQSLVPAMVVHACNNGLIFLLLSLLFPA